MEISRQLPEKRTYLFFLLILLAAVLWATFLLVTGTLVYLSISIVIIAAFISLFSFTYYRKIRTWIFFYLIVLVALLWAVFLLQQGVMLWVSVLLFVMAAGMSFFSFVMEDEAPAKGEK
ncbi:MAG: hypothetical protein A4E35_01323 [Methanoregula sp. PtaU1.Bin051]|nr:MAG: hypothetical protein A4E35_01323 [Methanoregula sp. PtaU1.Bin051]